MYFTAVRSLALKVNFRRANGSIRGKPVNCLLTQVKSYVRMTNRMITSFRIVGACAAVIAFAALQALARELGRIAR